MLCATVSQAQQWHFGPKLDLQYSGLKGNGVKSSVSPGWQAGAFAELQFNKNWGLQPELVFSWSRYKKAGDFLTYYNNYGRSNASEKITLAYVRVPVLLKYHYNNTFSFLAGPQYGYRVFEDENLLKNSVDAFKKYEVSGIGGVQVNISNVGFYARYKLGLSNINDIDDRYKWTSKHIQVGVAVSIK